MAFSFSIAQNLPLRKRENTGDAAVSPVFFGYFFSSRVNSPPCSVTATA